MQNLFFFGNLFFLCQIFPKEQRRSAMRFLFLLFVILMSHIRSGAAAGDMCRSSGTSRSQLAKGESESCDVCSYQSATNSTGDSCSDCFADCGTKGYLYICCCSETCCCYPKGGLCARDAGCPENTCYSQR